MIMKMLTFRKCLLDHEDFVSGMSFVSFNNEFYQSLQNNNLFFLQENKIIPQKKTNCYYFVVITFLA